MAELFTVINTFTLKDPAQAGEFEARFLSHVEWMRAQDGFDSHQAVRLTERPEVYVNIGRWRSPQDFKQVLGSQVFQEHAKEFHQLVDVVAAPSMNVLRSGDKAASTPVVVVESVESTDEPETFEKAWAGYLDRLAAQDGFRHAELSRSLVKPGAYTFASWWTEGQAYRAARAAVAAPAQGTADLAAHVTAHPTVATAA
ncbi:MULTISPECIES: antibiotic biosynthesis monooxygenase family protein [unclassified Streptomyces]|uniref:antibiotic biosynthesis monooxygenase family protein n=1 Tax=unclassified Streptomyces TaxID=2593676 RepID=UPI00068B3FB9|nr:MULTISPECIES: antibiotic biosynthesis monooxygenase [unclassified Streptomyces]